MGIFKKAIKGYLDEYFEASPISNFVTMDSITGNGMKSPYEKSEIITAYQSSVWVFACVREISENISGLPMGVKKTKDNSTVDKSKMLDLITNVNSVSNMNDFLATIISYLELRGEMILIKDAYVGGKPTKIYAKDPAFFKPIMNKAKTAIQEWKYEYIAEDGQNKILTYKADQVIYARYFNPFHPIRGMAPLEASRLSLLEEYYSRQYNLNFFKNDATISGVLEAEGNLSEPIFNRLKQEFNEKYSGASNAGKTLILEGGLKHKSIALTHKDMQYLETKKMSREEVCAVFRVPPSEVGIMEYGNYANSEQGSINFWTKTLLPKVKYIEHILNTYLFDVYEKGNYCYFDVSEVPVLQQLLSKKVDIAVKMKNIGYPLEVIDEKLRFDYLKDYDMSKFQMEEDTVGQGDGNASIQVFSSDKTKSVNYDAIDNAIDKIRDYIKLGIVQVHKDYKIHISKSKEEKKDITIANMNLDADLYRNSFIDMMKIAANNVAKQSEKYINDELGTEIYISGDYMKEVSSNAGKRGGDIIDGLEKKIRSEIFKSVRESLDYESFEKNIDSLFDDFYQYAGVIATTEVAKVMNMVRYHVMSKAGVKEHTWVVRDIDSCRSTHAEMHGETVKIGERFSNGMLHPTDSFDIKEFINCKCVSIAK